MNVNVTKLQSPADRRETSFHLRLIQVCLRCETPVAPPPVKTRHHHKQTFSGRNHRTKFPSLSQTRENTQSNSSVNLLQSIWIWESSHENVDFQNEFQSFCPRFLFTLLHNNSPFLIQRTVCVFLLHHLGFLVVSFFGRLDVVGAAAWASSSSLLWKVLMRIVCSRRCFVSVSSAASLRR